MESGIVKYNKMIERKKQKKKRTTEQMQTREQESEFFSFGDSTSLFFVCVFLCVSFFLSMSHRNSL